MKNRLFHSAIFVYLLLSFSVLFAQKNEKIAERAATVPYFMGFENNEVWSEWLSIDINGDGYAWGRHTDAYQSSSHTGDYSMRYYGSEVNAADDWVFSPKINLTAGKVYVIQFYVKPGGEYFHEKLTVKMGTDRNVASMTTSLWYEELCADIYKSVTLSVIPNVTGEYVIGFWCHSNINEHYVALDDFSVVEAGTITGHITDGNNPVEGAKVEIYGTDLFVNSDATGTYTLHLPQGEYKIKASKPGYSSALTNLSVLTNFNTTKNLVIAPLALDVPYRMGFEDNEEYDNWHIVNVNEDVKTWFKETQTSYANTGNGSMCYDSHYTNTANDWLISPKFNLMADTTYLISFHVKAKDLSGIIIPELLTCKMGNEQTVTAMTTELLSETVNYGNYKLIKLHVTPSTTGQYAFGFWCHSLENTISLCLDDFSIGMQGSVFGVVTDGTNPVEGVTIQINGTTISTTTNASGAYQFEELVADTYTFSTSIAGYSIATETVTVTANINTVQDFIITQMPLTPPYFMGFEDVEEYQFWTTIDADNNSNTWFRNNEPPYIYAGNYCMAYYGINVTANDWLVSPKIHLIAGTEYTVTFFTRSYGGYDNLLSLYMGTDQTVGALTTVLWDEVINSYNHEEQTVTVTVATTGEYVFGFWVHSNPQRRCFIDNFSIVSDDVMGTISGLVTDGTDPLENVLIKINGTTHTIMTDASGAYEFTNIPSGAYTLTASKEGYETATTDIIVTANTVTSTDFTLLKIPVNEFMYVVRISSNTGTSVATANVTLTNQDGDPNHVYQAVSGTEGIIFPEVWAGTYDLEITLANHNNYNANDLEITEAGLEHTALLIELLNEFMYTVRISSNTGASVVTANVTLTNQDGDPNHVYQAVSGEEGIVIFPEVLAGIYDLEITLANHNDYNANDLEITEAGLEHIALLIKSGINENTLDKYTLFPNPVYDLLTIKLPESKKVTLTIYNSLGMLVNSFTDSNNEFKVNVSNYSTGLYFINISDGKTSVTKKFIKQK